MSIAIHETGFLRLSQIIGKPAAGNEPAIPALIPVSKSTWWAGVKSRRYPQPVRVSARTTAWRTEEIRALIADAPRAAPAPVIRKRNVKAAA